jgi:hypothetical protein
MLAAAFPEGTCEAENEACRDRKDIPLNIVQRWLGHARIETTAIHASAIGDEERNLARRAWSSLELAFPDRTNSSGRRV